MSLYVGIEHDNYTKFAQVCGIPFLLLRLKYTTMFDKHYRVSHVLVDWALLTWIGDVPPVNPTQVFEDMGRPV